MNSIKIAENVIRRLLKEVTATGFVFLFPVLAAIIASLMFGSPKTIEIGLVNPPTDPAFSAHIEANGKYKIIMIDSSRIEDKVKSGELRFGIVIPLTGVMNEKIKLICIKDSDEAQELRSKIETYYEAINQGKKIPMVENSQQSGKYSEEILQSKAAIGMISMFIIMFIGTGMQLLLEDKKSKTFMRTFCAPIRRTELVLGHLIANFILGSVQICIFLLISVFIFQFDFGTSIFNVLIILQLFLITAIGLGIGIVGFIHDASKYNLVITITAVLFSFVGGCFFPLEYMNDFFKKVSNVTPQKWLMEAYLKLSEGMSLLDVATELIIVLLFGVVLFTFGIKTLMPSYEDL